MPLSKGYGQCPICKERCTEDAQVYVVSGPLGNAVYDVAPALRIVSDGREPLEVPAEVTARLLAVNRDCLIPEHMEHVDVSIPGIILQRYGGLALMDGTHRAARLALGQALGSITVPFRAYVLSCDESNACLLAQDGAELGPKQIALELRAVLQHNPEVGKLEVEIEGDPESDSAIREHLTPEENRRLELHLHSEQPCHS